MKTTTLTFIVCSCCTSSLGSQDLPASYSGVVALARAIRSQGQDVVFAKLVSPAYISLRSGSTPEDLVHAAQTSIQARRG